MKTMKSPIEALGGLIYYAILFKIMNRILTKWQRVHKI